MNNYHNQDAIVKHEIEHWVKYIRHNNFHDASQIDALKKSLNKIIQHEVTVLGYDMKNFAINYVNEGQKGKFKRFAWFNCPENNVGAGITFNCDILLVGLNSKIRRTRFDALYNVFGSTFHELQHFKQYLMTQTNTSSYHSLNYAREFITAGVTKQWYLANHQNFLIEAEADFVADQRTLPLLNFSKQLIKNSYRLDNDRIINNTYQGNPPYEANGKFYYEYYNNTNEPERDTLLDSITDDLIEQRRELSLLNDFPILRKEYNDDGSKKDIATLIKNLEREQRALQSNHTLTETEKIELGKDGRAMYYELIYQQLLISTKDQNCTLVKQFGQKYLTQLTTKMKNYFQEQLKNRLDSSNEAQKAKNYFWSYFPVNILINFAHHNLHSLDLKRHYKNKDKILTQFSNYINGEEKIKE